MRALTSAQDVTESALKAAFIYNFVKFTEWPADVVPAGEHFVMCVLGDTAVGEALERAVKTRLLDGHSLTVVQLEPGGPQRVCHVLYVSGVTAGQAAQVVARGRDAPVLTISDLDGIHGTGGNGAVLLRPGAAALQRPPRRRQARASQDQLAAADPGNRLKPVTLR